MSMSRNDLMIAIKQLANEGLNLESYNPQLQKIAAIASQLSFYDQRSLHELQTLLSTFGQTLTADYYTEEGLSKRANFYKSMQSLLEEWNGQLVSTYEIRERHKLPPATAEKVVLLSSLSQALENVVQEEEEVEPVVDMDNTESVEERLPTRQEYESLLRKKESPDDSNQMAVEKPLSTSQKALIKNIYDNSSILSGSPEDEKLEEGMDPEKVRTEIQKHYEQHATTQTVLIDFAVRSIKGLTKDTLIRLAPTSAPKYMFAIELSAHIDTLQKELAKQKAKPLYTVKTFFQRLVGYEESTENKLRAAKKLFNELVHGKTSNYDFTDMECLTSSRTGDIIKRYSETGAYPTTFRDALANYNKNKENAHEIANRMR